MNIRNRARTLALASLLALAVTSIPQGDALAESKCTPTTCGTMTCTSARDEKTYRGGEIRTHRHPITGERTYYMCDGFTGNWVKLAGGPSSGTVSPSLPTTNSR